MVGGMTTKPKPKSSKPLPCPFCGSDKLEGVEAGGDCYVHCRACGLYSEAEVSRDDAIAAWNNAQRKEKV
jgi:Lar family restriction alleviation protein